MRQIWTGKKHCIMESLTHQVVKAKAYLLHLDTLERAMTELIIHTVSSQLGNLKI